MKQTRSFQWINPALVFENKKIKPCLSSEDRPIRGDDYLQGHCHRCVVCTPNLLEAHSEPKDQVGLLWVGEKFYPSAEDWSKEAMSMGVSKRIAAIPKGLVVGKTYIFTAHPKAITEKISKPVKEGELLGSEEIKYTPGIFHVFVPRRIELIVTPSMKKEQWVKDMVEKNGVQLVEVPEDDPDHAPDASKKSARKRSMDRAARKAAKKTKEEGAAPKPRKDDEDDEAA